jgi:hypothetical protein
VTPAKKPASALATGAGSRGLADRQHFSINDDLGQRRARREVDALLAELRCLVEAHDAGLIELDQFACTADVVTARLADIALLGVIS